MVNHMSLRSYNTSLANRTLWYDGESSYNPTNLIKLLKQGITVDLVDALTPDIINYNNKVDLPLRIAVKDECKQLNFNWNIPVEYQQLNVVDYVSDLHFNRITNATSVELSNREIRLARELNRFKELGLFDLLRALIYIINTLLDHNIVLGVGRGSSVSSYVLYVLGAHEIDSFKYNLDIDDFLHE